MSGEPPSRMTPLVLGEQVPATLADLAARVLEEIRSLGGQLHPATLASLADLVRLMNCYYSNLIEGHPTRPADMDAALHRGLGDTDARMAGDPARRRLLQLSLAHIRAQEWIDRLHRGGTLPDPASTAFLYEVHRRFYDDLPIHFREIRTKAGDPVHRVMQAGVPRRSGEHVEVGRQ